MKILFDENMPRRLKKDFGAEHRVFTVRDLDWEGIKNGALLGLMISRGFEVLITLDKSIPYQQNMDKFPVLVLILGARSNHPRDVAPFLPKVLERLSKDASPGVEKIFLEKD